MALRIVASRPDPAIVTLPWSMPLEEWGEPYVVPLPRGLSRHVVRIVRLRDRVYAVKETVEEIAFREYRLLRDLQRLNLPAVVPQGVVTGRVDADGEELPSALLTEHLRFSLPYRSLFSHGLTARQPARRWSTRWWCCWSGCTSRTSSGATCRCPTCCSGAAPAASRRTSWTRRPASCGPACPTSMREYDLTIATENVFAELLDLQASESLEPRGARPTRSSSCSSRATHALWERADRRGGVLRRRDVADRAADRAAQRPRLRRRRARHRHRLRRRPGPDPAQGRRGRPPPARAAGAHRAARRGRPGPAAAQRHRVVHRRTSTSAARTGTWSRTAGSTRSTSRSSR